MMDSRRTRKTNPRGPFRNLRRLLGSLMSSRVFLRILSLLAAIVIWCVLIASEGSLTRHKEFKNVPISASGEQALLSRGYIVTDDLGKTLPRVTFACNVPQSNFNRATQNSYNPHIDLSAITGEGEAELPIAFTLQSYGPVTSCEPASVKLNVERYITRRVPVVIVPIGEMPEGLYLVATESDPYTVTVSGPQSVVSRVARASVSLDRSRLSAERLNDRMALDFVLQDADAQPVTHDKMQVTNQSVVMRSVTVETQVLPTKRVPLDADGLLTGTPAEGYEVTEVWTAEANIEVAAEQEILDSITLIEIETPLDVTGADSILSGNVRLRSPIALRNRIPVQTTVTAIIEEKEIEKTFGSVSINIEGASEKQKVSLSHKRTTVQLKGGYHFIRSLSAGDITLYVDVSDLPAGQYRLPVQVRVDNAEDFTCALRTTEVTVTVREP